MVPHNFHSCLCTLPHILLRRYLPPSSAWKPTAAAAQRSAASCRLRWVLSAQQLTDMDLRSELLKSIWYAFTSLDVEKCGKVSKSQLKVSWRRLSTRRRMLEKKTTARTYFLALKGAVYVFFTLKSNRSVLCVASCETIQSCGLMC